MLAGVSSDYYVRLEQGRERHPSVQVVDALSRALHLDGDATDHLQRLARPIAGRGRAGLWAEAPGDRQSGPVADDGGPAPHTGRGPRALSDGAGP
nr:helix-turn-helix transcriptional regulator [Streptomyces noursei]